MKHLEKILASRAFTIIIINPLTDFDLWTFIISTLSAVKMDDCICTFANADFEIKR